MQASKPIWALGTWAPGLPRRYGLLAAAAALLGAAVGVYADPLEPFSATYRLEMAGLTIGTIDRSLAPGPDGRFRYRSESRAKGLAKLLFDDHLIEESLLEANATGLRPIRYSSRYTGHKGPSTVSVRFDWRRSKIKNQKNDRRWELPLSASVFDKLLYQLAIMVDLGAGKRDLSYRIVDGHEIKTYRFLHLGTERVKTPLGVFDAVKIERRKENSQRKTTLWCAPRLRYLAVRLDNRDGKGREVTALLDRLTGITAR
ncbi:MAG: DUF3108 domain-containing protein [Gammaproteobacteria bacterium]